MSVYAPTGDVLRVLLLLLVTIAAVALILAVVRLGLRRIAEAAESELQERYPGEAVLLKGGASFFGKESAALRQVRGNGLLVLTRRRLLFRQAIPGRWIEIPLERIRGIENPRRFLYKTAIARLLVVRFINEIGEEDAVGWAVREAEKWADMIAAT